MPVAQPRSRLFGRAAECRRIDAVLADAGRGRSAALVVRGEAGMGKSTLLEYALAQAAAMDVLTARGIEAESRVAFATLHELLRPALDGLNVLPVPQAAALESAFALGAPALGDVFAVGAATLGILAAAADRRPLLALLDDAQWADPSSLEAILFAARRLRAEGVALLFAVREGEILARRGIEEIVLGPLPPEACAELLAEASGAAVAAPAAESLSAATGGNPLALTELARLLTEAQLAGREPLPQPLPALDVEAVFLARIAALPEGARRALV